MICLTGGEASIQDLVRRLASHQRIEQQAVEQQAVEQQAVEQQAVELQEVRLDLLCPFDEAVYALLRSPGIIATCRSAHAGGGFSGSEAEQAGILRRALQQQPGYLDLDLSLPHELRQELFELRGATRMILSHHDFQPGAVSRLSGLSLREESADLLKLAITVEDAAELHPLLHALSEDSRPILRIGMGDPGLISRALYSRFGSPWTFVAANEASRVAPGQLTLERAAQWRVAQAHDLTPLALVGGAQVMNSPGPLVYNTLLARYSLPWIYLPVVTNRPAATLDLLEELGFSGCSITMPAKELLAHQMDELRPPADVLGVINTALLKGRDRRVGLNTDMLAIKTLLQPYAGMTALVLGGGGAARAALFALSALGCPATLACRDDNQARWRSSEMWTKVIPWPKRHNHEAQILINATPQGSDGVADPLAHRSNWKDHVVLDMIISATPTPLLQRAAQDGARVISGLDMWFIQGALQLETLIGSPVTPQELRRIYHE